MLQEKDFNELRLVKTVMMCVKTNKIYRAE